MTANGSTWTTVGMRSLLAALQTLGRGHNLLLAIGALAIVVASVGLTLHPRLLLLLPALGFVLLIGIVWPWLSVLTIRGALDLHADRIHEGEEVEASLSIRQRGPWPVWGLQFDVDESLREMLEPIRPLSSTVLQLQLRPRQRGSFPSKSLRWRTGFPFGLVTASKAIAVRSKIKVWPRILPVAAIPEWAHADLSAGHAETRRVGNDGDTVGVREYRRGDPMRWIHWAQTARHDRFMVREFQASGIPRVWLVLDCDPSVHVGVGSDSSFEWAVRIAASIATGWLAQGAEVGLVAGRTRIAPAGGSRHRIQLLDALADVSLYAEQLPITVQPGDAPSLLISTDVGWAAAAAGSTTQVRGYMLRQTGFGGVADGAEMRRHGGIVIEAPGDVGAALLRNNQGLAGVA